MLLLGVNGKGSGERGLLLEVQDTFQAGDVVLGDAFYPTYFFIAAMQAKGVDILMEQDGSRRRSTDFRRGKRIDHHDHLVVLKKSERRPDWMSNDDYESAPESITVREFKADGKIMVTTILDKKTPKAELKLLYKSRWQVELDIRYIKDTMGMNILSCKTPDMAIDDGIRSPINERLSLVQLLEGYTQNGAYQLRLEDRLGSIETGKLADFVILNKNLFEVDPFEISKLKPSAVVMEGKVTQGAFPE